MKFDAKKLTGAEMIAAEKLCGGNLESTAGTFALYHQWLRRSNPEQKWEDTLNITLEEITEAISDDPKA
jgi:hypothetical protein